MTLLSDSDLMEQFSKQVVWQNFFATEVAQAEIEEAEAEAVLKTREAMVVLNGGKLTEGRLARDVDTVCEDLRKTYRVSRARRKMLTVAYENRERCAMLLSRELTRRVGREGPQRRADRWAP